MTKLPAWVERMTRKELGRGDIDRLMTALSIAWEALESSEKLDKTQTYEYGQADRQGNKPGIGQRWKTPKELAKDAMRRIESLGESK